MGLIQAVVGATQDVFADTWREYFYGEYMDDDTLMVKGKKRVSGKSSNTKGTENVISNGSIIAVNEGQCMIIVDQGAIAEVCAQAGEYIYDSSTEPSIFYGNLGKSIVNSFKTWGRRVSFGGDVGKDQRVYFVNIREIFNNKFGTQQPIQFRFVADEVTGIKKTFHVRCNGEFSFRIGDPIIFYKNVATNVEDVYEKSKIFQFMRSGLLTALNPAFGSLARQGFHYADLTSANIEMAKEIKALLQEEWMEKRGIEFSTINVQSTSLPPEEEAELDKIESDRLYATDARMHMRDIQSGMVEAMKSAASNENGAMTGFMGVGMMNGMMGNMNNSAAGMMGAMQQAQQSYTQQPVQQAQPAPAAAPAADSWTCTCGAVCTGNFCMTCGAKKPAPVVAEGWTCTCGTVNKGNFCPNCGSKRPAGAPLYRCDKCGWEPADPKNPPKFCPECGDPFDEGDIK